ncbi:MAG: hypothetical protein WCK37_03795 [Candidatus Falkowbacteria bacterium]
MNKKKYIIAFIILVAVIIGAIFFITKNSKPAVDNSSNKNKNNNLTTPTPLVEGRVPETWNDINIRTEEIKNLIAQKINQSPKNVTATISYEDGTFADGVFIVTAASVNTTTTPNNTTNIFLAMKNNGKWDVLWTGENNFPCSIVNQYKMPERISRDCK